MEEMYMTLQNGSLDKLREEVFAGLLTRRSVLKRGMALGLSAPVIATLLAACGDDDDDEPEATQPPAAPDPTAVPDDDDDEEEEEPDDEEEEPTAAPDDDDEEEEEEEEPAGERGGLGNLNILYWQAVTILNAHHAQGTKDFHGSRVVYEPLYEYDADLNPVFYLGTEYPSVENETLDPDGMWVIWKLREGVKWHDGEDFTAEDVKFTYDWIVSEGNTPTTLGVYDTVQDIEIIDDYTVQINFTEAYPLWFDVFRGSNGLILPEHLWSDYMGEAAREAPMNMEPVGTGAFKLTEFRPGDVVLYEKFDDYWDPGKPHFDTIELKGGGDAGGAARAVLQTGEADWAWNAIVEPQVLQQLLAAGEGTMDVLPGVSYERILVNHANPREEVNGFVSEPSTQHPIFSDQRIRKAIQLAIPRDVIAEQLYGEGDAPSAQLIPAPELFSHPDIDWEFDLDAAQALLDEAGFDGFDLLYQTSDSPVRQRAQEIVKAELEKLGFSVQLKSVTAAVYFSGDPGNPDTTSRFSADLEKFTTGPSSPLPIRYCERWRSDQVASSENSWTGANYTRYQNPQIDEWHDELKTTIDVDRQVELIRQITMQVHEDVVEIPILALAVKAAKHNRIGNHFGSTWQSTPIPMLKDWTLNE
jgi:peptide/nickel transport system substrate-binding protein